MTLPPTADFDFDQLQKAASRRPFALRWRSATRARARNAPRRDGQRRADLAEQRLADLKAVVEDLRQDRDHWRVHAGRLALADAREQRPWWRRLAG